MKLVAAAILSLSTLLASCAGTPPLNAGDGLLHDELFAPPSRRIDPDDALALSPAMRTYIATRMPHRSGVEDRRQQLVDVLYAKSDLQLEYDAAFTRTAAQAFDARSGNCLALVLMTAAFAKEMGLAVRYQVIGGDDAWERTDDLTIAIGHVNLTLDLRPPIGTGAWVPDPWTVDFIPQASATRQRARLISERTVVAMYLNNRAVESLTEGRTADAYWWARAALAKDPQLRSAYLTLGVVYRSAGQAAFADTALVRLLEREPDDTLALANRVLVLRDLGRGDEAEAVARRLAQLDPHPPFSDFNHGMAALREGRLAAARDLFAKETARTPYHAESEFWLAMTYAELKDPGNAQRHLARALAVSTTRQDRALYAAKLERLKGGNVH